MGASVVRPFVLLLFCFFQVQSVYATKINVAVAANFLVTMEELATQYEAESGIMLNISSASSGKIYAQIMNGAPYDVFLSADQIYTQKLIENNKALRKSRFVYARGTLVLWSRSKKLIDQNTLLRDNFKYLSIANPKLAPYGAAAEEVMSALGVKDALKRKIVKGESVGQAFQFVATGNAEYGFVAASQVLNTRNTMNRSDYWLVPSDLYTPILQEAVMLSRSSGDVAARDFMSFLQSSVAKAIIGKYGYQ